MQISKVCFFAGLLSIPLSIGFWFLAPQFGADTFSAISDAALRNALITAHSERWGIFVGLWPATLLLLSNILESKK